MVKKRKFKWTKRVISVVVIIPVLLFLAFAGAVNLIDFNQYKPQIEQEVGKLTNREFKIEGNVEVSVLPFMFHLEQISLSNPPGFKESQLMTMKEVQIELSLRKFFLDSELKIRSLELIEPKLHFIEQADTNNWTDIPLLAAVFPVDKLVEIAQLRHANIMPSDSVLAKPTASDNSQPNMVESKLVAFKQKWSLESLVVKNAEIAYSHKQQDFTVRLKQANLLAFDVLPNEAFQINSDFIYEHSQSPRTFDFEINGQLLLANNYSQLHLSNWNGVFRLQLPAENNRPDIRLSTSGKNLMVDFKHQQIYVNAAQLRGLDAEVNMSFQGEFGVNPVYEGVFEASNINLINWIEHLGLPKPETLNKEALKEAGGKFSWRWDGEALKLNEIEVKLDDSSVTGYLDLPFAKDQPVRFDLKLNQFDSQRYAFSDNVKVKITRPGGNIERLILGSALSLFTERDSVGKLELSNVRFADVQTENIQLDIQSRAQKIVVAPFDVLFQQGALHSKLEMELGLSIPTVNWQGQTDNLDLQQLQGVSPQLLGLLSSHFYVNSFGSDEKSLIANLNGTFNANLTRVKLFGLDVNQLLSGEMLLNSRAPSYTEFDELKVHGKINNGIYIPKRVLAKSERFSALGFAEVDLVKQQVLGLLEVTVEKPSESLTRLKGVRIPVTFQGALAAPNWSVNLAQLSPKLFKTQ